MPPVNGDEPEEPLFLPDSPGALLSAVYDDLRKLARGQMASRSDPQTLTATALVHEAWLRVSKNEEQQWESQRHFYNTAAQAMRRILIDRARARQRQKRWGGSERVELEESQIIAPAPEDELLAVNDALTKLSQSDPGVAEIVHLRFFAGLKWSEISAITGITERRLRVQWDYARAWLRTAMREDT